MFGRVEGTISGDFFISTLLWWIFNGVNYRLGQQNHSSKFPCYLCYGFRQDQRGEFPGSPAGRWTPGPLRSHYTNDLYYNRFEAMSEGMDFTKAKEKFAQQCFSVVNKPIQLHSDPHLPYIHFLAIDPLHTIKLGQENIVFLHSIFTHY